MALSLLGNKRRCRKASLVNPVLSESHRKLNDPCLRNKPQNVGVMFIGMCFAFSCKDRLHFTLLMYILPTFSKKISTLTHLRAARWREMLRVLVF